MKLLSRVSHRKINSEILTSVKNLAEQQALCAKYSFGRDMPQALEKIHLFTESLTTPAGPGNWRDYHCYFACMAGDLDGLNEIMQNHAVLESDTECEVALILAQLCPLLREITKTHNSLWTHFLSPEAWKNPNPQELENLYELTKFFTRDLAPRVHAFHSELPELATMVNPDTISSIRSAEFLFAFPTATQLLPEFCDAIARQIHQAKELF